MDTAQTDRQYIRLLRSEAMRRDKERTQRQAKAIVEARVEVHSDFFTHSMREFLEDIHPEVPPIGKMLVRYHEWLVDREVKKIEARKREEKPSLA